MELPSSLHAADMTDLVLARLAEYVSGRSSDVARGAETPHLAALLVQKYGQGMADATAAILGDLRTADPIATATDKAVGSIDPDWRENARRRWAARPADIVLNSLTPPGDTDGNA